MKYKVGDKIKILKIAGHPWGDDHGIAEITTVHSNGMIEVYFPPTFYVVNPAKDEFEFYEREIKGGKNDRH